jgi:anion-transporting  ArsA/GET3 family ATPase
VGRTVSPNALQSALKERAVLVCVGAGGVGKTTVAAALALRAASGEDRSALVCTIDPARRLANSLGLSALGNQRSPIPAEVLTAAQVPSRAALHAMMLDMKQTWDELVERHASPEMRERILTNRFYRALSSRLAGSQEYIAMEKLCQLRERTEHELVVLDTPPTAHAMDFLDAPNRVLDFLDNDAARWLLTPALAAGKVGFKFLNLGGGYAFKTLAKLVGAEALEELAGFMLSISSLNESFRDRARRVSELLTDEQTRFVLVTAPTRERLDEAVQFHALLAESEVRVQAVVVNRVHAPPSPELFEQARTLGPPFAERVAATLREAEALASYDAAVVHELAQQVAPTPLIQVPRFDLDVHDLRALWETGRYLVGEASVPGASPG